MKDSVATKRLNIIPLSDAELEKRIDGETDPHMKGALREMLDGCLAHPDQRLWYTEWQYSLKNGELAGSLDFKGPPADGEVEIGYGTDEAYRRHGYCFEAVRAMISRAFTREDVVWITAETEPDNTPSKKLLEKLCFVPDGEGVEGPRFRLEKPVQPQTPVLLCLGLCIGICAGISFEALPLCACIGGFIGLTVGVLLDRSAIKQRAKIRAAREKRL